MADLVKVQSICCVGFPTYVVLPRNMTPKKTQNKTKQKNTPQKSPWLGRRRNNLFSLVSSVWKFSKFLIRELNCMGNFIHESSLLLL